MNRLVLDGSSQSSTAMNIRKFIKDTELSDHMSNRNTSTLPSTAYLSNKDDEEKYLIYETGEPSFHFINRSLMEQINKSNTIEETQSPLPTISDKKENKDVMYSSDALEYPERNSSVDNENDNGNNSYQNKLKYLPNADFKYDSNNSYSMSSTNSPVSIPNTFKYKSHPNAKTKSKLGAPLVDDLPESPEHSMHSPARNAEEQQNTTTAPMKTSTLRQQEEPEKEQASNADINATPDWMPEELADKWIAPNSLELENYESAERPDFASSVRITRPTESIKNANLDFQFSSINTMIHNSKPTDNETPMWKKATKEYEFKKSQPHLHNIFLSMDSLKDEGNTNLDKSINNSQNEKGPDSDNNNNSASSTISTPMASISNKSGNPSFLTRDQINQLENILEEEAKDKPNDFLLQVPNPESPLKLFGDKYNTFTKGKLTDLLQKINTKTPSTNTPQIQHPDSEKPKKNYNSIMPETAMPLQEPLRNIKNFTKSGTYTEEQFLQNANNIFNNIQKRGFKMKQDIDKQQMTQDSIPNSLSSAINSQNTATSTPKNHKVNDIEVDASQDEYSSFTSGFDDQNTTEFQQYNTNQNDGNTDTHHNEYTSFDESGTFEKGIQNEHFPQLSPRNLSNLQRELSNSNESSYTIDDEYSNAKNSNINEGLGGITNKSEENNRDYAKDFACRLDDLEKMMKGLNINNYKDEIQKLLEENNRLKYELSNKNHLSPARDDGCEVVIDDANFTQEDISQMQDFIKWKRASQLKLLNNNSLNCSPISKSKEQLGSHHPVIRGRVEPGIELPVQYDNMILDIKNQKWVTNNDKENQYYGSLDSIEDLLTRSEDQKNLNRKTNDVITENKDQKIKRYSSKNNNKTTNSKLEVSFNLPNMEIENESLQFHEYSPVNDATQISQMGDVTFSQTKKKLVSVITDILSLGENFRNIEWGKVLEIFMSGYQLDSIKDLNKFLPRLTKIDLSDNNITFLDGLPKGTLHLDLSNNKIENMTSFKEFHDLQHLNLSFNKMADLSNIKYNIHLTELSVSRNQIVSLEGVKNLENLIKLDVSQNDLIGEINFKSFNLPNLQELNLSENNIQSLGGLQYLPSLRILNANENQIVNISCTEKHLHLKKFLLKSNSLKKLNLEPYLFLRILRIDGNELNVISDLKKLKYLEELSCKSQNNSGVVMNIFNGSTDVQKLDLSGNSNFNLFPIDSCSSSLNKAIQYNHFLNLNHLVLSAMNLSKLPYNFADMFPNVRELNLNFNKLSNISALSKMKNIKRLNMVSNNVREIGKFVESLKGIRRTLKVLDLRLNPINIAVYPYVFNPEELEYSQAQQADGAPIQLETLDDIESFAIHYHSLSRNNEDWTERDSKFSAQLKSDLGLEKAKHRLSYETLLINYFIHLKKLDGGSVTHDKRKSLSKRSILKDMGEILLTT